MPRRGGARFKLTVTAAPEMSGLSHGELQQLVVKLLSMYPPEAKSLAEATVLSGCAGVKLHRQEALCIECKGLGDEAGGAVCEGPLRGTG